MPHAQKYRENRLRRVADRQGLTISRSRVRDPQAKDFGLYAVINVIKGTTVNPSLDNRWLHSWTLDEAEDYIYSGKADR